MPERAPESSMPARLLDDLRDAVGSAHVLTDPDVVAGNVVDWTGRFHGSTPAVVRPGSTADVAAVVRACAGAGVPIVPQGGNTGLVGGATPRHGELVVDLRRLDERGSFDPLMGQITVGAGVTLAALQDEARSLGWAYGVDLGARATATVGGMIATNAGGVHVLRYGPTRRQLVGVEAVLADGSVIRRLGGLEKDNTGYDLAGLLCGSEGTLGIVTAARLRLVPVPRHTVVALLAFDTVDAALVAVGELRRALDDLHALELMFADGLALVCDTFGLAPPFRSGHAAILLVEAAGRADPTTAFAEAVAALPGVADTVVATDTPAVRAVWRYREDHTEAINRVGVPVKLDVTVSVGALAAFVGDVRDAVHAVAPRAQVWLFGHAADGNVHVNVTGVDADDEAVADAVTDAVLHLVAARGGSISAEHGIGAAKRRWLHLSRSVEEIASMRAIKRALDPDGILNPNVLLPEP